MQENKKEIEKKFQKYNENFRIFLNTWKKKEKKFKKKFHKMS